MKSAIITGASRGIGRQIAIELSSEYDYLAICCKSSKDQLNTLYNEIKSNCAVKAFIGDVADYDFVKDMVNTVITDVGSIHTLINNAGISVTGVFSDTTPSMWQNILNTNLSSIYNTCHSATPNMIHNKDGRIINISSVWGVVGASCEVAYSATKGAINSFTKALAKELAPSNISVNAIAFGAIDTEMNNHLNEEEKQLLCDEIPFGRMASAKEAAMCVSKLLAMPSYFTGEVVKFDGAWI